MTKLRPVAYDIEFPEGFISVEALLDLVLEAEDKDRLPGARKKFSEARVARTGKQSLADLRLGKGLTQEQLAVLAKTTQPRLSLWESRREKPSIENVRALARALEVSCDTVIGAILDE